jgi:integrase/recombinase XerD
MLTLWRYHNPKKCNLRGRQERKCKCPIWISGVGLHFDKKLKKYVIGNIKESTKLRDWSKAEAYARHYEDKGSKPEISNRATVAELEKEFLGNAKSPTGRNLAPATVIKYEQLLSPLKTFCEDKGYRYVNQLDFDVLTEFKATWKDKALSASKKIKRLRNVLNYAMTRKWIAENPALLLDIPKINLKPTLPFSEDEQKTILEHATDPKTHALIQTMLHSGLRIGDVAMLKHKSLHANRLQLHQTKTGEHVSILIPEFVADELRNLPKAAPGYFFFTGKSVAVNYVSNWQSKLAAVFADAEIEDGHSHRFRDTFSVRLLTAGVSLESVSQLLGHNSIATTQKHYSPWIKSRQDALDNELKKVMPANNG